MHKGRITGYAHICPLCKQMNTDSDIRSGHLDECHWCGYPTGKDWETVEIDLETDVIVRTVICAQPKVQP